MSSGIKIAILLFATMLAGMLESDDADYSTTVVQSLLAMPEGFSAGFSEKQLQRLGDRLAIAIIKLHDPEDLKDPKKVRRFLPLLEGAFGHLDLIQRPLDKKPQVTLILLAYLSRETPDPELGLEAAQLATTLRTED